MYSGFNLRLGQFNHELREDGLTNYNKNKELVHKSLSKYLSKSGVLDGSKIQEDWFPQIEADIFLSHSHNDLESAISLSGWIEKVFGLKVFIDSCIWGNSNALLAQIDKEFCSNGDGTFNYERRNYSTSHVHMMLSTALTKMIDKSEAFFFYNTSNSLSNLSLKDTVTDKTKSPWLYHELEISRMIRKQPKRTELFEKSLEGVESKAFSKLEIEYNVSLGHLVKLSLEDIKEWLHMRGGMPIEMHPLDLLYKHIKDRANG